MDKPGPTRRTGPAWYREPAPDIRHRDSALQTEPHASGPTVVTLTATCVHQEDEKPSRPRSKEKLAGQLAAHVFRDDDAAPRKNEEGCFSAWAALQEITRSRKTQKWGRMEGCGGIHNYIIL